MDFRILGELEVEDRGRVVELGGARQRALLTSLLLHAGEVVSADRLIDDLYGAHPPASAAKTLQAHVSRLRKALGPEQRLRTRGGGYVLEVSDGELDVERFSRLLEEGRRSVAGGEAEHAVATLERALALWRGRPLADVAYAEFAQGEVARLEEMHLAVLEELIEARLALGLHADAVGELDNLVAAHPLRERLRASLLLALYRSGRQAEALEAYQVARSLLVEELGIEPTRSLRELHQAILNQDPALDLPAGDRPHRDESAPAIAPQPVDETVVHDVRKTVTVVFVRLVVAAEGGAPVDPEALRHVTGRAFEALEAAAERHGGTIETVSGDAITAVFGLPLVHEDDALRGVRAAVDARTNLVEMVATLGAERALRLDFRIGISTGEVVTGGSAAAQARAIGEPLTKSSRLVDGASPGEILVDATTRRVLRDAVVAEPAGADWRVVDIADVAPERVSPFDSPMVGRERERRRLQDTFDQAVGGRSCQLFTVLGVAGVGKSRLVHEFLQDLGEGTLVAAGRCLPYGEGITYWPLLEAVKSAVGLDDGNSPDEARAKLARVFEGEQGGEVVAQQVAEMIGLADAVGGAEEGFSSVLALFETLARAHSLVIVFDDVHWGEPTFLDLIEHVADWARDAPILLVCLARPELLEARPGWAGGKLNATTALLEPLSEDECGLLIENLIGLTGLADEVQTRITDAAEGNPLFVEEMLLMLIDDGLLARDDGRWAATGDVAAVRVPPTIQALLAARLDRLDVNERSVVERAAVVGKVFYEGAVANLVPDELRPAVAESLGTLVRKQLIRPDQPSLGGRTFLFRHLLIRDAAYESIPKEVRAQLHERFGRWLERAAGARVIEYEEVVGYHLEQAYRYRADLGTVDEPTRVIAREAAERLGSAGRRAFGRSDAPAAVNLISRAVALLPAEDPLRVDLVPNVRAVQGMTDLAWADKVLTEAVEAAATTGSRRLAASALVQRGFLRLFTEPETTPEELIDAAERAIAVFDEFGDELGLARGWRLVAQAHYLGRRLALCAEASERALEHARCAGDRYEEREIVEWLVISLLLGPAPAPEAARRCERLLEETPDDPLLEAEILGGLAALMTMLGHADLADEFAERSRAMMNALGESIWIVSFWLGFVRSWQGDPSGAERELRPAYDALKRIGEKSHFSSMAHELSNAVFLQGRYDEAEQLTRECEESARPNDVHSQVLWRSTRAKVFAHKGNFEAAEELARASVAIAAESDFHPAHAGALMDLAHVLELRGDREPAARSVEEAIHFYELKANLPQAERARVILTELRL
jgi:predicted ATPase/DNA-binding SARP family transcriptional activator/class 3 adenylate cyclase